MSSVPGAPVRALCTPGHRCVQLGHRRTTVERRRRCQRGARTSVAGWLVMTRRLTSKWLARAA